MNYICPICGNEDSKYLGLRNGKIYCRRCISFRGQEASENNILNKDFDFELNYELSEDQKKLSNQLVDNYRKGINSLVHAVCGSGKTEIVLDLILFCLIHHLQVGFAIPRRDVIIELHDRFKKIFKNARIALVYGGHTNMLEGDIVCCTTHQLFRYTNYFDLLILDEIDAFPFHGDETLNNYFYRAVKGHYVLMSATTNEEMIQDFKKIGGEVLTLNQRFHRYPLPVPEIIVGNKLKLLFELYRLMKEFKNSKKQVFIFVPTIDMSKSILTFLNFFFKNGNYVSSKRDKRENIIEDFKKKRCWYLVTTSILERGVTVKDLQVIIYQTNNRVYTAEALIQIAGRAGRKKEAPEGRVIYLAKTVNESMEKSIKSINDSNKDLQDLF